MYWQLAITTQLRTQLWEGLACDLLSIPDSPMVRHHLSSCQAHFYYHQPQVQVSLPSPVVCSRGLTQLAVKPHAQWSACPTSCHDTSTLRVVWHRLRAAILPSRKSAKAYLCPCCTMVHVVPLVSNCPCFIRISCVSRKTWQ